MNQTDLTDTFWDMADMDDTQRSSNDCSIPHKHVSQQYIYKPPYGMNYNEIHCIYNGNMRILFSEWMGDGVMGAVGGHVWEAAGILSTYILLNAERYIHKSVLELGSGIGIPGLVTATMKQIHASVHNTPVQGHVCFTDNDDEVLNHLSTNIARQFTPFQTLSSDDTLKDTDKNSLNIRVEKLDWMCDESEMISQYDVLVGSELVYTPSLSALANIILNFVSRGCQEVTIVQMQSRIGFSEFLDKLDEYHQQSLLQYTVEPVSTELYEASRSLRRVPAVNCVGVCSDSREEMLLFPGGHLSGILNGVPCYDRSCDTCASLSAYGTPVVTSPREDFVLLRVYPFARPSNIIISPITPTYQFRVATFNVNNRRLNCDAFAKMIQESRVDVICLNEASHELAKDICRLLRKKGGPWKMVYAGADYTGNALLTKLPVISTKQVQARSKGTEMRSAAVAEVSLNGVAMVIVGTHLSHVHEKDRIEQMRQVLNTVGRDCIILGDLNALRRKDYSSTKWADIADVRERGHWVPPESRLMDYLLDNLGFRDARLESKAKSDELYSDTGVLLDNNAVDDNPVSTCRFDTRIDWILLPPLKSKNDSGVHVGVSSMKLGGYRVLRTRLSDHNFVSACLTLSIS